jgi:hypothetical protein
MFVIRTNAVRTNVGWPMRKKAKRKKNGLCVGFQGHKTTSHAKIILTCRKKEREKVFVRKVEREKGQRKREMLT